MSGTDMGREVPARSLPLFCLYNRLVFHIGMTQVPFNPVSRLKIWDEFLFFIEQG